MEQIWGAKILERAIQGIKEALRHEKIEVKFLFNINLDMYVYAELTASYSIEIVILTGSNCESLIVGE